MCPESGRLVCIVQWDFTNNVGSTNLKHNCVGTQLEAQQDLSEPTSLQSGRRALVTQEHACSGLHATIKMLYVKDGDSQRKIHEIEAECSYVFTIVANANPWRAAGAGVVQRGACSVLHEKCMLRQVNTV